MQTKWTINPGTIDKACQILGIKQPVTIDPTWTSWWYGQLTTPAYTIRVSRLTPVEEVEPTIWHELGHALQIERDFGGDFEHHNLTLHLAYLKANIFTKTRDQAWTERYFSIPMEREAEDIAQRYSGTIPLIG